MYLIANFQLLHIINMKTKYFEEIDEYIKIHTFVISKAMNIFIYDISTIYQLLCNITFSCSP